MTTLGQGPLIPLEEKLIKDAIVALVMEHGPDAVKWVWNKLKSDPVMKKPTPTPKGSGGALVALAVVALATKKKRRRR